MMSNNMPNVDWNMVTAITAIVVAICGAVYFVISKIFTLGKISERLKNVEGGLSKVEGDLKDVKKSIKAESANLAKRIDDLMGVMIGQKGITEANSPRQLTAEGTRILTTSGINEIMDEKFDEIVSAVKKKKPENAYQAEQDILSVVAEYDQNPTIRDAVENGSFNSGSVAPIVLFVGGIYIRDRVLEALGLKPEEIDGHTP